MAAVSVVIEEVGSKILSIVSLRRLVSPQINSKGTRLTLDVFKKVLNEFEGDVFFAE